MVVMCCVVQSLSPAGESTLAHKRPRPWRQSGGQVAMLWPGDRLQGVSGLGLMVASSVGGVLCWGCQVKGLWSEVTDCTPSWRRKRRPLGLPRHLTEAKAWATRWSKQWGYAWTHGGWRLPQWGKLEAYDFWHQQNGSSSAFRSELTVPWEPTKEHKLHWGDSGAWNVH